MEKLERVLVAEEDARQAAGRAVDEANAVRAAALQEAARLERESAESSRRAVETLRDELLAAARAQSEHLTREAETERAAALSLARDRLDSVVTRLTSTIEG